MFEAVFLEEINEICICRKCFCFHKFTIVNKFSLCYFYCDICFNVNDIKLINLRETETWSRWRLELLRSAYKSLACKCVFYRPEHNANEGSCQMNFDGLKMQKWNIPMDRAQTAHEKNRVICLIIFSPGVIAIKMSKTAHFLYFLLT